MMECPTCKGLGKLKTLACGDVELWPEGRVARRAGCPLVLTPKEFDLLEYLAINQNIPLSRQQIYEGVWGGSFTDDLTITVHQHIYNLRRKLGPPPLIHTRERRYYVMTAAI